MLSFCECQLLQPPEEGGICWSVSRFVSTQLAYRKCVTFGGWVLDPIISAELLNFFYIGSPLTNLMLGFIFAPHKYTLVGVMKGFFYSANRE